MVAVPMDRVRGSAFLLGVLLAGTLRSRAVSLEVLVCPPLGSACDPVRFTHVLRWPELDLQCLPRIDCVTIRGIVLRRIREGSYSRV